MVYNWDEYHDVCYRLYIDEKKPLDEIMQIMRSEHGFAPSKRAYQIQFRRWDFPSKQNPAHKNDRLVARVQELWAKNLSQKEMLRVLTEEDGFDIKHRELMRVRSRNRWLLRKSNPLVSDDHMTTAGGTDVGDAAIKAQPSAPDLALSDNETLPEPIVLDSAVYEDDVPLQSSVSRRLMKPTLEPETPEAPRLSTRKRRRRARLVHDGLSTNTPGPSRFPSETTIDESRAILNLDAGLYRELRLRFARICEATGISKKTEAGPTQWEEAKGLLVGDIPHLQTAMWASQDNVDGKRLALDVICTDVTKRMRTAERKMTIAEAKSVLEINPEESRTIRQEYVAILKQDNFGSKVEAGKQHWEELKMRWMSNSAVLFRVLAARNGDPMLQERLDAAVEVMATDILKRLRDDQSRREPKKATSRVVASASPFHDHKTPHAEEEEEERIRITAATPAEMSPSDEGCLADTDYTPVQQVHLESTPTSLASNQDPTTPEAMHMDPGTSPVRTSGHLQSHGHRMGNSPQAIQNRAAAHHQPLAASHVSNRNHMMPGAVLDHSIPIDPHLDTTGLPALLEGPNISAHAHAHHHHAAQTPSFMTPQHIPSPVAAQQQSLVAAPSQHNAFAVPSPFPTHQHQHHHHQPVVSPPAPPVAVYLRLHPSSPLNIGPPIWISTLTTRTFAELRQVAVKEFSAPVISPGSGAGGRGGGGVVCERVEGILGEGMTIEISRDDELRAYLAVVEGRGGSGPQGGAGFFCAVGGDGVEGVKG
ncbi:hypothetical protein PG996_008831 [Apiospora saccharicola]|uniref:Clr5 domain-containing protein n=1 Tax=Apiospora saccharicola TaxID=335842 RepID=A0ABR1UZ14_9PEZI